MLQDKEGGSLINTSATSINKSLVTDSINSRYEALDPHPFQRDIYLQVKKNWTHNTAQT